MLKRIDMETAKRTLKKPHGIEIAVIQGQVPWRKVRQTSKFHELGRLVKHFEIIINSENVAGNEISFLFIRGVSQKMMYSLLHALNKGVIHPTSSQTF